MTAKRKYKALSNPRVTFGEYEIVPIRDEDKFDIMRWRNEQMYHLRQKEPLTEAQQEAYFKNVVDKLFEQEKPDQLLFSFLKNGRLIGYGGLVHIDWDNKTAEVSFLMDTTLEKTEFERNWRIFLHLLEQIAFKKLGLKKIYTYAFDLRQRLYPVLEKAGFRQEKFLPAAYEKNGRKLDVYIHAKTFPDILFRNAEPEDVGLLYEWANEETARKNSFHPEKIPYDTHVQWFEKKLKNPQAHLWIAEIDGKPAALVRFDENNDHAVIGINMDKNFRGKGYGGKILRQATDRFIRLRELPVYAYIKPENIPSVKAFEKAGFVFTEKVPVNGRESLLYIKNLNP